MTMRKILILILLSAAFLSATAANPADDARALIAEGRYAQATELLQTALRRKPRDGALNLLMAKALEGLARPADAHPYWLAAEKGGHADAALHLADEASSDYRAAEAIEHYDAYRQMTERSGAAIGDEVEGRRNRALLMANMLSRVERIVVIDSLSVDAEAFFTNYRLSPEAGRLVSGATARIPEAQVVFMPQNNSELLYAAPDESGKRVLMSADILDDGSVEGSQPLPGSLGGDGNADFPFMLSDGLTLYFAADGENSLGGYDIFLTRRDADGGFLQPQNIGMPFNSPANDYMLAIDEATGAGWWATDRGCPEGKLTIYVFVPSEGRVNVAPDDPRLTDYARLANYRLTQPSGSDYSALKSRIAALGQPAAASGTERVVAFSLPIASTDVVYHSLADFKTDRGRSLMTRAIDARLGMDRAERELAVLRAQWAAGAQSLAFKIVTLEEQLEELRSQYRTFINQAIEAELSR